MTSPQEAVVAMESGTREVESGYEVSLKAEEALQEIGKISQTSAELAGEISHASQQQVQGAHRHGTKGHGQGRGEGAGGTKGANRILRRREINLIAVRAARRPMG